MFQHVDAGSSPTILPPLRGQAAIPRFRQAAFEVVWINAKKTIREAQFLDPFIDGDNDQIWMNAVAKFRKT